MRRRDEKGSHISMEVGVNVVISGYELGKIGRLERGHGRGQRRDRSLGMPYNSALLT